MKRLTKILIFFWALLPLWTAIDAYMLANSSIARSMMLSTFTSAPTFSDYFRSFFLKNFWEVLILTIGVLIGQKYGDKK